ncbi:acyl-CoA carboxylase epsilon subunit [Streptomyces sp. NPDC053431]|uniref:acyl-CoA carboxylase epsilon subunit n=1 Tax=Streptomyces sp. NPDC053431 TaxID=3365703 RepID=UPI0037D56A84
MTASADTTPTTPAAGPADTFLRIEKGSPDATELAALTAVLLARTAALTGPDAEAGTDHPGEDTGAHGRRTARWRRLERRTRAGTPRSWRDDTRR